MFRNRFTVSALIATFWFATASAQGPLLIGSAAPSFKQPDQNGQLHSLEEYKGKWLVLYFYAKDQTPGCTIEATEFRDNIFAFKDLNAAVVGVSVDNVDSHKKFEAKNGLPFTLLADPTKEMTKTYGVLKSYMGTMELARRETFLIDPAGKIVKIYRDVEPKGHAQIVLGDLKTLQKK